MALIDREFIYEQLVLKEIAEFYEGLPSSVRYERKKHTKKWSQISLLCGVMNKKPNDLIDALIERAFEIAFSGENTNG